MLCAIPGCGAEKAELPRGSKTEAAVEPSLRRAFADTAVQRAERLAAGMALLRLEGGAAYLSSRYRFGDRELVLALLDSTALGDPGPASRLAAGLMEASSGEEKLDFEAFLLQRGEAAVQPLVRLVRDSGDWQTVLSAMDALGKLKAREATGAMGARLRDPNTWVRMGAAHALGEGGDRLAVLALIGALEDTADVVVAAALVGLGRSGDDRVVPACVSRLSHPNPRVRGAAAAALGRLGGKGAAMHLERVLDDPDEGVRYKASRALSALRSAR